MKGCNLMRKNAGRRIGKASAFPALLFALFLCLQGCSIPTEEIRAVQPVREDDSITVPTAVCVIGDVVSMASVSVAGLPAEEAQLSFGVTGKGSFSIRTIYVKAGEKVSEGEILAELDCDELDEKIAAEEATLQGFQKDLELFDAKAVIETRRDQIRNASLSWADRVAAEEKAAEDREASRALILDDIEFSELRLSRLLQEKERYVITAPFDGTIISMTIHEEGEEYKAGRNVIRIGDLSFPVFRGETQHPESFRENRLYTITLDSGETEVQPVSASELQLPEKTEDGSQWYVYFMLTDDTAEFSYSRNYAVRYESANHPQVLTVPTRSVYHANDADYVYMLDENGSRIIRMVETGASNAERTEIFSGLSEGEVVIYE